MTARCPSDCASDGNVCLMNGNCLSNSACNSLSLGSITISPVSWNVDDIPTPFTAFAFDTSTCPNMGTPKIEVFEVDGSTDACQDFSLTESSIAWSYSDNSATVPSPALL